MLSAEDRSLVEEVRRAAFLPQERGNVVRLLLAILDRVDPPPPPERIVVSQAAREAYRAARFPNGMGFDVVGKFVDDPDAGLRAAFKVMLRENVAAAMARDPKGLWWHSSRSEALCQHITGETVPE